MFSQEQKVVDFDCFDEFGDALNGLEVGFCCLGTTKYGKNGQVIISWWTTREKSSMVWWLPPEINLCISQWHLAKYRQNIIITPLPNCSQIGSCSYNKENPPEIHINFNSCDTLFISDVHALQLSKLFGLWQTMKITCSVRNFKMTEQVG